MRRMGVGREVFPQPVQRRRGTQTHDTSNRCRNHRLYPPHLISRLLPQLTQTCTSPTGAATVAPLLVDR